MELKPSKAPSEDDLQKLIANHPRIVSEDDGELLLVKREKTVPGTRDGSTRFWLDLLFVTSSALPVLIEVKRSDNTQIRREVVGQLIEYAANASVYWSPDDLQSAFQQTAGDDSEHRLDRFMQAHELEHHGDFWEQVSANLKAGRMRLVIAADIIPDGLARMVEFLNDQMQADVRAVELRYFKGDDNRLTLVPRIIGETQRARTAKGQPSLPPISIDQWIEWNVKPDDQRGRAGMQAFLDLMQNLAADRVEPTPSRLQVSAYFAPGRKLSLFALWRTNDYQLRISIYIPVQPADDAIRGLRDRLLSTFAKQLSSVETKMPTFAVEHLNEHAFASDFSEFARDYVTQMRGQQ